MSVSGFYAASVTGNLRCAAQATQWDTNQYNPSGYRHWESGGYVQDAKERVPGGFDAQNITFSQLDFGEITPVTSGFDSKTVILTMNLGEVNNHPSSRFYNTTGIGTNFKLFNIRFWLSSKSAFTDTGYNADFYYKTSVHWLRYQNLGFHSPDMTIVPTALPTLPNVYVGKDNSLYASGSYKDLGYSHYIYMFGHFSGAYPLGTYGTLGGDDFTFRFTYDWTEKGSDVLATDFN
jgi:hypothetical protein